MVHSRHWGYHTQGEVTAMKARVRYELSCLIPPSSKPMVTPQLSLLTTSPCASYPNFITGKPQVCPRTDTLNLKRHWLWHGWWLKLITVLVRKKFMMKIFLGPVFRNITSVKWGVFWSLKVLSSNRRAFWAVTFLARWPPSNSQVPRIIISFLNQNYV